ncbi:MAG: hypothetical protein JSV33_04365 [bacterium]|nr:MAG: hypothetical protein JSV33_04365 [bacterium]
MNTGKPSTPQNRKPEDIYKLSQQIIYLVNLTGLGSDFLRRASELLLNFFECEEVDLALMQDEKYLKCTASRFHDGTPIFKIRPYVFNGIASEDKPKDITPLEKLSNDVLCGEIDGPTPYFSKNGSFWTGDCDNPFSYKLSINGKNYERKLDVKEPFISLALIPITTGDEKIGYLLLKSASRDYFNADTVNRLEEVAQTLGVVQAHRSTQLALRERVKELTCLYNIAQVAEQPNISLDLLIQKIVEFLPPAGQYPEITSSRIIFDNNTYCTPRFRPSDQKQSARIIVRGTQRGIVEVVYTENKPDIYEGPFLKEERNLLNAVAREVALIIERKEAEEAESILQDQLRHADRLATISQLAAGVAHELNEPLGSILGFAQLAMKGNDLSPQAEKDIEKIVASTLHAREIVKKLMYFARQMPPEKVKCDLNQIVEEGVYFLGARCAKTGIELIRKLTEELPLIIADPAQLHQVLINLAVNSMQAMPEGGSLTISTLADNDHVSLVVEDTGIGMDADVMKQIFVPFYTTKDVDEGTGLGLAVVHGIVSSHGGTIDVESEPKQGSKFVVRLPIKEVATDNEEE